MTVCKWLLKDDNPAVQYRTRRELLGESADKSAVVSYGERLLPARWKEADGLRYTYYLTAIAECGLSRDDIALDARATWYVADGGCESFLRLRALAMLGFAREAADALDSLSAKQLPDGGFLCDARREKINRIPKSCAKSNIMALLAHAECIKRGIQPMGTDALLEYFWNHRLFYRSTDLHTLMLDAREGWRSIDVFFPPEPMRVGLQNIVEAFCAMGYGADTRLGEAWSLLDARENADGRTVLGGTLTKSYLPREKIGAPSKWATLYTQLARKERG